MGPQPYYQPRPVPAWAAPLPPPARTRLTPPPRGWRPPPFPAFPGYPVAQPPPGYPAPPVRPVYLPPVAYGQRPKERRRSYRGLVIGGAAFVLVAVLMLGTAVVWALHSGSGRRQPVRATATWQYPATTPRGVSAWTPSQTSPTVAPTESAPPLPPPAQPVFALGDHPLFRDRDAGFTNAPCSTSTWPQNAAQGEVFYGELRACLDVEWRRQLDALTLPWSPPGLVVAQGDYVDSPCGGNSFEPGGSAGFYCSSNNTIYMSIVALSPGRYGNHDGPYLAAYAHEYAHHGQELSGMMGEQWRRRRAAGIDSPAGLELSRRLELQAQCFSGMFVGSRRGGTITEDEYQRAGADQYRGDRPGDPRDHGTFQHGSDWWWHGAMKNRNWECNTWMSPSDQVS
ncbi:neutral zinc metallopeptidase [Mycobacteroides franklinii]|uniref:neutral zinc metallopeptidase n=1 Tax=Mycobacteroides franklinii TaxID=948102 RepID=UPI001065CCC1